MEVASRANSASNPFRVKQTAAIPKHTLFGTTIEMHSKEEREAIQKIDLAAKKRAESRSASSRPCSTDPLYVDRKKLKENRQKFALQKTATETARENLKHLHNDAILMCTGSSNDKLTHSHRTTSAPRRGHQWYSGKDLEHTDDINLGYMPNNKTSFNHDKYAERPPVHSYSLIGDVFRHGMEFNEEEHHATATLSKEITSKPRRSRHQQQRRAPLEEASVPLHPRYSIDLPANIRHGFGSKVCDHLFGDESKREKSSRKQKTPHEVRHKNKMASSWNDESEYERLGHAVRQNVFPGCMPPVKLSHTKSVHGDAVFQRRVPDTNAFRCHRDELSTWSEHNIIRDRMKKAWDAAAVSKTAPPS